MRARAVAREGRRRVHWVLALLVLFGTTPSIAHAQAKAITGSVNPNPTTREPGASIVQLTDLDGRTISAVRPTASGAFSLRTVGAGRFRLRLLRLGYEPVEIEVQVGADDVTVGTLDGPGIPVSLAAVRVRGATECASARRHGRVGELWPLFEVALATQVADQRMAGVPERWLSYEQRLNARSGLVEQVRIRDETSGTTTGFHAAPASALAGRGFVAEDLGEVTYFLPVAGTLLSPEFLERYCFAPGDGATPDSGARSLAFRANGLAPGRTDVAGDMVFSADGEHLEYVRFEYVNLPSTLAAARAFGNVMFSNANDRTAIGSWWVDMPIVGITRARAVTTARKRVGAVRLAASRCASCPLRADSTVPGLALQRDTASDDPTALVTLRLATSVVPPRAEGSTIPWPPGRYEVHTATAWMAAHRIEQMTTLEVADVPRPTRLGFGGLSRSEVLRRACSRDMRGSGAVGGAVATPAGLPLPGVAVVVSGPGPAGATNLITTTDERGYWRVCLPSGQVASSVWAISDGDRAYAAFAPTSDGRLVDLVIQSQDESSVRIATPSILEIRVRSPAGESVADAEVSVESSSRRIDRRRTDARGLVVFLVPGVGEIRVSARKLGLSPANVVARVERGRNAIGLVLSPTRAGQLDTVRILGDRRVSSRLDAFETRARLKQPNAVLRADHLSGYSRLSQALGRVPGVFVVDSAGQKQVRSTRSTTLTSTGCRLRVIIDGVPQPPDISLDAGPSPMQLHGVEVYLNSSRIPLEYGGTLGPGECGLLIAWTKDESTPDP
jgi:hypothetical protein